MAGTFTIGGTGSGADYPSWDAFQSAQQVAHASGETVEAQFFNSWPGGLGAKLTVSGWTAGVNLVMTTVAGDDHDGTPGTGFRVFVNANYNTPIDINSAGLNVTIRNLESYNIGTVNTYCLRILNAASVLIEDHLMPDGHYGIYGADNTVTMRRVVGYDLEIAGLHCDNNTAPKIQNSGFLRCAKPIAAPAGGAGITAENVWQLDCTAASTGTFNAASRNNASSDLVNQPPPGSAPYPQAITAADFIDAAGNNVHLAAGSGLASAGADLSTEFAEDVDGEVIVDWPIGFDAIESTGAGAFDETAAIAVSVPVSVVEAYSAPDYLETAAIAVSVPVSAVEVYSGAGASETASVDVMIGVSAVEVYSAPAYLETSAIAVSVPVSAVEVYSGAGASETASVDVMIAVSAVEAYSAPVYLETAAIAVSVPVAALEVFTEPGSAFGERATVALNVNVQAFESYAAPSYSEGAVISFSALIEAGEIYGAPGAAASAAIAVPISVNASEVWAPPQYIESSQIDPAIAVLAFESFFSPSALPAGIFQLNAVALPGLSARVN